MTDFDAVTVGAGFGGIYQLYLLVKLGLSVRAIDTASDVGGTWYWNTYPGAMSDTEAYLYRYSWDREDLVTYPWHDHYITQPEVLRYLNHVVDKQDLRKHIQFNTRLESATFDEENGLWRIIVSTGETFTARYLVTALGLLSKTNLPDIQDIDSFQGEKYHTGNFPKEWDFTGKRVGVIGCGSTGVQVITELGKPGRVRSLACFQRRPQYSVPSGNGPVSPEYRDKVNKNYEQIWGDVKKSVVAFGFPESNRSALSVSAEERDRIYQEAWDKGNGFRFMFWTFNDIIISEEANKTATDFIRRKIAEIVRDPEKRRKLTPHDLYARRPLCDGGYYQVFNQDHVSIIDLKETTITKMTTDSIVTSDGTHHELDVVIFATGFDAVDGNYTRINILRGDKSLSCHWKNGPTSYLGICVPHFPNLMMITGPNGPFTNLPPTIETHAEFIRDLIKEAEARNPSHGLVEATEDAGAKWTQVCNNLTEGSLFKKQDSWIFGANMAGKKPSVLFFFGGLADYRKRLEDIVTNSWQGFSFKDSVA